MAAAASMEHTGTPIDVETLTAIRASWDGIQTALIEHVDTDYGIYEGRTFKRNRFAQWLADNEIPWPRLESGQLALDDDTFRQMARTHPGGGATAGTTAFSRRDAA